MARGSWDILDSWMEQQEYILCTDNAKFFSLQVLRAMLKFSTKGFLGSADRQWQADEAARVIGASQDATDRGLAELERSKLLLRNGNNVLYSPFVAKLFQTRAGRSKAGRKGAASSNARFGDGFGDRFGEPFGEVFGATLVRETSPPSSPPSPPLHSPSPPPISPPPDNNKTDNTRARVENPPIIRRGLRLEHEQAEQVRAMWEQARREGVPVGPCSVGCLRIVPRTLSEIAGCELYPDDVRRNPQGFLIDQIRAYLASNEAREFPVNKLGSFLSRKWDQSPEQWNHEAQFKAPTPRDDPHAKINAMLGLSKKGGDEHAS